MPIDYQSLLLAIVFSGAAISLTLLAAWNAGRRDRFLLSWAIGMLVLSAASTVFSVHVDSPTPVAGALSFSLLSAGFAIVYGAARQFRGVPAPFRQAAAFGLPTVLLVLFAFGIGASGVGMIIANLFAGAILLAAAAEFWRCREEAPGLITSLCGLYVITAASFALCGLVLLAEQRFVVIGMPDNWAEDVNVLVSLMGITGIGAISIALNYSRLAQRHLADARTDPLTGLLNRRSLLDTHAVLAPGTALVAFDLDNFKSVNDRFGHAVGDRLLQRFAQCIVEALPAAATGARIGGEEFVVILPDTTPAVATRVAENIRTAFESVCVAAETAVVRRSVSAGIAVAGEYSVGFDEVLRQADVALYAAKRDGRNRVRAAAPQLAA